MTDAPHGGGSRSISGSSATKPRRGRPLAAKTLEIREAIKALTEVYERMTVRGIFYALETRGVVPKGKGYRPVQRQVLLMRREGLLPWDFVADGTRWRRQAVTYDGVDDALREITRSYRRDLWASQRWRVEVWLEKDALADLIWPIMDQWSVPLLVSRGVSSETFIYDAAQDAQRAYAAGRTTKVFTLFDYDMGGQRAHDKIERGMQLYAPDCAIVQRLAVKDQQIAEWKLPTRPANERDPQAKEWKSKPCVELDAIPPDRLTGLVEGAIVDLVDEHAWRVEQVVEAEERQGLLSLQARFGA